MPARSADSPTRSVEAINTTRSVVNGPANAEAEGVAVEPARGSRGVLPAPRVSNEAAEGAPKLSGGRTAPPNRGLRTNGLNLAAVFKRTRSGKIPRQTIFTNSMA